jgi:hypothetical protein
MPEPSITLNSGLGSYFPDQVFDMVFVRRDDTGKELYSFSLYDVLRAASVRWEELVVPVGVGQAGQGIYLITGDIVLVQNDSGTMNALQQHLGRIYELHVIYGNGAWISSALISGGLLAPLAKSAYSYISDRFNLIENYRTQMGVALKLVDDSNPRQIHLSVTGATTEKINYPAATTRANINKAFTAFYAQFKKLNLANIGSPIFTGNTGGNS